MDLELKLPLHILACLYRRFGSILYSRFCSIFFLFRSGKLRPFQKSPLRSLLLSRRILAVLFFLLRKSRFQFLDALSLAGFSFPAFLFLAQFFFQIALRLSFHIAFMSVSRGSRNTVPYLKYKSKERSLRDQDQSDQQDQNDDDIPSGHTES